LKQIGKQAEAMKCFEKFLQESARGLFDRNSNSSELKAIVYRQMGCCCVYMGNTEDAIQYLQNSLHIQKDIIKTTNCNLDLMLTLYWLGNCLIDENPGKAVSYLFEALEIQKTATKVANTNNGLTDELLYRIGHCLFKLNALDEAIQFWQRALDIKQETSSDHTYVARTMYWIGRCFVKNEETNAAIKYFQRSIEINERISLNVSTDCDIAVYLYWIGNCFIKVQEFSKAVSCLQQSLDIFTKISTDISKDNDVAVANYEIGLCLLEWNKPKEAISFLT